MFSSKQENIFSIYDKCFIWSVVLIPLFSDWKISSVNLGDLIMVISLTYVILSIGKITNLKSVFISKFSIFSILLVLGNFFLQSIFKQDYNLIYGLVYSFKLLFYLFFCNLTYNYISMMELQGELFTKLIKSSIIVGLVGIFLTLLLYFDFSFPTQYFWMFTRSDKASYLFRGTSIIRMKSFFSEPSYLGLYLNLVLSIYLLTKFKVKLSLKPALLISFFTILTFSFSAFVTLAVVWSVYFLFINRRIIKNRIAIIIIVLGISIVITVFHNQLYETFVRRLIAIYTGVDTSSINRLFGSWKYVNFNNILIGNGIGVTPSIWNNFAYILSDLGIIVFTFFLYLVYKLSRKNFLLTLMFVVFSFQRGGYLNCYYWFSFLIIFQFSELDFGNWGNWYPKYQSEDVSIMVSTMNLEQINEFVMKLNSKSDTYICNQVTNGKEVHDVSTNNKIHIFNSFETGLSRSRNLLLSKLTTQITLISDDDMRYIDNYDGLIANAFNEYPIADVIIFNLDNMGNRFIIKEPMLINQYNFTRFGSVRIAFKSNSILSNVISFPINFGSGSKYGSGEDTLFLKSCIQNNLTIIGLPICLAELTDERESTWFNGYDQKFFFDKGALYSAIGYWYKNLNILQFALRKHKLSQGQINFVDSYNLMKKGEKSYMLTGMGYNDSIKFSVVIPMYNAENSIAATIESLKNQVYTNFEAILVDDGSEDQTLNIATDTIDGDDRFLILRKENGGVSTARNFGMSHVNGDFVSFLDSDDTVESRYFSGFNDKLSSTHSELVYCGYNLSENGSSKKVVYSETHDLLSKYLISSFHVQTACFSIDVNLIKKYNLFFDPNLNWGEDILFFSEVLAMAKRIACVREANVNYYIDASDNSKLSYFNLNKIDKDVKYLEKLEKKDFVASDKKNLDIITNYRLPAQIVNKLLKYIGENGDLDDAIFYYEKYSDILSRPASKYSGLRSIKLVVNKRKLRRLLINDR